MHYIADMNLYEHRNVLKIFPDLKTRTLISWSEKGLFKPEVEARGPGTRRGYSKKNLIQIGVIRELVSYGLRHAIIKVIMYSLEQIFSLDDTTLDYVIIVQKQLLPDGQWGTVPSFALRSIFSKEAGRLVFDEGSKDFPPVGSATIISVNNIWGYIQRRL